MLPPRATLTLPAGLSLEVPDLLMLRAWAEFHDLRMKIDLDITNGAEEYEEIVTLSGIFDRTRRWMIWRSAEGIVVQPHLGRPMTFDMMAAALDLLIPAAD